MLEMPVWLPISFFLVALTYSMAGFAGGSSYLAILVLAGLPFRQIPPTALLCNLIVSISAFFHFRRGGHFDLKKVLPFVVFSIPMAYAGGRMRISKELFCFLLGGALLIAGTRLFVADKAFGEVRKVSPKTRWLVGLPTGAALGFLSGLVGIGGGIFLSPLLLFWKWANPKEAAAAASFFILVNSLSGLLGQLEKTAFGVSPLFLFLGVAVLIGGQLGACLGSYRLPKFFLQRVSAALILYAAFRLISRPL